MAKERANNTGSTQINGKMVAREFWGRETVRQGSSKKMRTQAILRGQDERQIRRMDPREQMDPLAAAMAAIGIEI